MACPISRWVDRTSFSAATASTRTDGASTTTWISEADVGKLTAAERKHIPMGQFAGPHRSYPINDASHARNALSRVSQNGSPALQAQVRAAVHRKYPGIGQK